MAVQRRNNWVSQQRVDVPDVRSIESASSNDFDQLLQSLILSDQEGYVLRGFDIIMTGAIGGAASGLQMNVSNASLLHPFSKQSGTFFVVPEGTSPQILNSAVNTKVSGAFTPSSQNFVGIEYSRSIDDATAAQVYLWDPTISDETTSVIPRAIILDFSVVISTGTWAANVLPVSIVTTDAGNNVISVEDTRRLLFRLGTGGRTSPNPFYSYPWNAQSEGRVENPFISSSNGVNPFHGGDKMLFSYKDWQDAVMTKFKEITGSAFWYSQGSSAIGNLNMTDMFFDTEGSLLTMRGKFIHSAITPGMLTWTGVLHLTSIFGPLDLTIAPGSVTLNDNQIAYISLVRNQNFQPANVFTFTNGLATVTATTLIANIFAGDWIKFFSDDMSKWAQVQSVSGTNIVLTAPYEGASGSGLALRTKGSYTVSVADPDTIPVSSDTYWIAKRDDNGLVTASIAAPPTGAVRSGGITTFTTTAAHGINAGQGVTVSGVTDSTFNGSFEVLSTPSPTTFTVQNTGADGTSGNGTVNSNATIYLRGIGIISQGQSSSDVSGAIEAILQYIGSSGPGDTQPQYGSTNYVTQGIDLTSAISQLDAEAGAATALSGQDRNIKLVPGNNWSWVTPPNLVLASDSYIQVPGLADVRNRIAAQTIVLNNNDDVAYVEINRVAGAPAALTVNVVQNSALVPTNNTVIIARRFSVGGVAAGAIVGTQAISNLRQIKSDELNSRLYFLSNVGQVTVYDISSPASIVNLGSAGLGTDAFGLTPSNGVLIVGGVPGGFGTPGQMRIYDVSVPASIGLSSTTLLSNDEHILAGFISGTTAFMFTSIFTLPNPPNFPVTLRIYDISTPATPVLLSTTAAVTNSNIPLRKQGNFIYGTNTPLSRLQITDVTTLASPVIHNFSLGYQPSEAQVVNGNLYVTGSDNFIHVYDITVPLVPVQIATIASASASDGIDGIGTTLLLNNYATNIGRFFDVSTPATPVLTFTSGATVPNLFHPVPSYAANIDLTGANIQVYQIGSVIGASQVIVGNNSMKLSAGESKSLFSGLSDQNLKLIGGTTVPIDETTTATQFSVRGAPQRTIDDTQSALDAQASMDAEIDKFFGQLRLIPHESSVSKARVTGSNRTMKDGSQISQSANSKFIDFDGAVIDLITGNVFKSDGVTALGANFTPIVIPVGNFIWYAVSIVVDTTDALNATTVKLLVSPSTSSSPTSTLAPFPNLSSTDINSGALLVQNVSGVATLNSIKSLGVGSGSGGGGGGTALIQPKATAIAYTDGLTQELNCDPPSVAVGKMRLLLHFTMDAGDFVEVFLNQKKVPLFVNLATTPGPYYKVIANNLLEFDQDYTTASPAQLIEIETFEPAAPTPVPSMLAGLQLKGRSYSTTDDATLYNTVSNTVIGGKTVVVTTFDILTTDVVFVEVDGVYYPQLIDPVTTPGHSWELIGPRTIQFDEDLSSPAKPIDIRAFQGQSFIDEFGNVTIALKAAVDNIILQSPDTTKWIIEATNVGELDPTVTTIGTPDPLRLKRDGDNVVCAFVIDNLGELGVDDAPSPGILVDTLHIQSPNGLVWRIGIAVDSSIYLEDGFGNKFTITDDAGNVYFQVNETAGGMVENDKFFSDKDLLPTPPTLVAGTVPSAKAYDPVADRIFEYIYTNGAWRQVPLLEPGLVDVLGIPIGTPFESMLNQSQMDALYGANKCVIADGRDVSTSRYATVTGTVNIPDLRGMYRRAKNNGRTDGSQNPDGDLPLGAYQVDTFQDHSHVFNTGWNLVTTPAPYVHGCITFVNQHGTSGAVSGNAGAETRPRSITVNVFIRIN